MDETQIARIARQVAEDVYQQYGNRFGVNQTPRHQHTGVDAPKIPLTSVSDAVTLSAQIGGVLNGATVTNIASPVAVLPIPVLTSNPSGDAPDGTIVLVSGLTPSMYARIASAWVFIGPYIP